MQYVMLNYYYYYYCYYYYNIHRCENVAKYRNTRDHCTDCRERISHARGVCVYPTQGTSRMRTIRVKLEEAADTRIMVTDYIIIIIISLKKSLPNAYA